MTTHTLPPSTTASDSRSGDFVLYGDEAYAQSYGREAAFSCAGDGLYPLPSMPVTESYANIIQPTISDELQQIQDSEMNKQFYYLPATSEAAMDTASSYTEAHYTQFDSSDDLDSPYMPGAMTTTAPGVLIHPPTMPYLSRSMSQQGNRSTPTMSPATSPYYSGSDAGSATGSPFHHPIGAEAQYTFDSSYVALDPVLIGRSPPPQPSAGHPASPWGPPQSPPLSTTSNPGSPNVGRDGRGGSSKSRLSPRFAPYPHRRPSTGSMMSWGGSQGGSPNMGSVEYEPEYHPKGGFIMRPGESPSSMSGKEGKETLCSECKKCFRDLRAHQITHQLERPEKCPISTCEYSKKGFARKYDCQRHTLTHYKGTMVCGFCPGSGSSMEKSFNRADVFKRHLMAVHNVEQTAPNGRQKKTNAKGKPAVPAEDFSNNFSSGKCSTCSVTFATAQQFYEHLDDCVLSKVCQEEPAARANEANLAQVSIEEVEAVLSSPRKSNDEEEDDEDEDDDLGDAEEMEDDESKDETFAIGSSRKKNSKSGSGRNANGRSKLVSLKRQGSGASR